jgi:hypothetical protein
VPGEVAGGWFGLHALISAAEAASGISAVAAANLRLRADLSMGRAYLDGDAGRNDPLRSEINSWAPGCFAARAARETGNLPADSAPRASAWDVREISTARAIYRDHGASESGRRQQHGWTGVLGLLSSPRTLQESRPTFRTVCNRNAAHP